MNFSRGARDLTFREGNVSGGGGGIYMYLYMIRNVIFLVDCI